MKQNNSVKQRFFEVNLTKLIGDKLRVNRAAPDYVLFNSELREIGLTQFNNKIKIIVTFDSLAVPAYEEPIKKFNSFIGTFYPYVVGIIVSRDLPYAQKQFGLHHQLNHLIILSDYKYSSFGINYGLLVKELNVLANAMIILDGRNMVRYFQISKQLPGQFDQISLVRSLNRVIKTGSLPNNPAPLKRERCYKVNLVLPTIIQDYYDQQKIMVPTLYETAASN